MPTAPLSEFKPLYHDHVRHDVIDVVPEVGGRLLDLGGGIGATAAHIKALGKVDEAGTADMVELARAFNPLGQRE